MKKYPQPHRKMYLAYKKNKGIKLSADDLQKLFLFDDAMLTAANQEVEEHPWIIPNDPPNKI